MFESISWQEFLTTIAVAIGSYYAITTLLLYRQEITNIFKQRISKRTVSETNEDQNNSNQSNHLMGKVKYETEKSVPREKIVSAEELNFRSSNDNGEPIISAPSHTGALLIGTIADILQEIKTLAEVVKDSSKEEAASLFKSLLIRYPQLAQSHYKDAVSLFIQDSCKEHCKFDLELKELNQWWPEIENAFNNNQ